MRLSAFNPTGENPVNRLFFVSASLVLFIALAPFYLEADMPQIVDSKTLQVSVVDIMPESLSGETETETRTEYDSEPNIAVNPANRSQIAASALTREPLRRADRAPIFVSLDGGETWSLHSIIPSPQITCDCTLRFGSSSDVLYVSALRNKLQGNYEHPELVICQSAEYATTRLMAEVFNNRKDIDQPYIAATTVAGKDDVFVGDKDYNYASSSAENGQAAIVRSLDSPSGSFTPFSIEFRDLYGDNCEVRPAIATDGNVVYAAFNHLTAEVNDGDNVHIAAVVVVRDDNRGASTPPFSSLKDPGDKLPGVLVVKQRAVAWNRCLGGDRLGGDLAIAVHPSDKNKVYLVWSDWAKSRVSLHLKYSTNGGKDWSDSKRDIADAKNPGLAVNAQGTVAFLYQQVMKTPEGYFWMTQFERTTDDFKTTPKPITLAKFPTDPSLYQSCCDNLLLGDYLHLMSVGNDFYGIFSSSNVPDRSRFPCGVKFLRKTDFNSKKLLDQQGKYVSPSIDPFFFKVSE
jgi:hypothetical protein